MSLPPQGSSEAECWETNGVHHRRRQQADSICSWLFRSRGVRGVMVLGGSSSGCFLAVGSSGWVPPLPLSSGGTALQLSRICRRLGHCFGRAGTAERA